MKHYQTPRCLKCGNRHEFWPCPTAPNPARPEDFHRCGPECRHGHHPGPGPAPERNE